MADINVQELPYDELLALNDSVSAEIQRRGRVASAEMQMEEINATYMEDIGAEQGVAWEQPSGAHSAYPLGWVVTHIGKTWESLVAANVWEPPVNWREQVLDGQCPDFVAPTGSGDAYNAGDCVAFEGKCYTSLIAANVWTPTDYPAGWEERPC